MQWLVPARVGDRHYWKIIFFMHHSKKKLKLAYTCNWIVIEWWGQTQDKQDGYVLGLMLKRKKHFRVTILSFKIQILGVSWIDNVTS